MKVFQTIGDWRRYRQQWKPTSLGFVPTMGALHVGHLQLVQRALAENAGALVSLFVNPTQFDDPNDLKNYPHDLEADLKLLQGLGTSAVLVPTAQEMYPLHQDSQWYRYRVQETTLSGQLCGACRPGHFEGMLTVVLKLLQIAQADRAYFGKKDYQQLILVQNMARDFFLPTEIVGCPIVRDQDGLAHSSRNQRLDQAARAQAVQFAQILAQGDSSGSIRERLLALGLEVDYVEDWPGRRLAAVRVAVPGGKVRLIDNVEVQS